MDNKEFRKMLDAIKADVDEIEYAMFNSQFTYCSLLADGIVNKAEKIRGFCKTLELAQEIDRKSRIL